MTIKSVQPKVSIIVPVYNVEQYLNKCITSLFNQTLQDIEIILVDDGSPDKCPLMCDEWAKKDTRIKVVHKKNQGLGLACNSGIEIATGEYVAFCDSDDYVDACMYETMYKTAKEYQADAVYSGIKTVNQNGIVKPMNEYVGLDVIKSGAEIQQYVMDIIASEPSSPLERSCPMSAKVVLYRKKVIDDNNLSFVSERVFICEDLIWNMDFLCHSKCIIKIPQTFYYYYNNTNSLSKKIRTDRFPYFKTIRKELLRKGEIYKLPFAYKERVNRMFIGYCRFYIGQICNSSLPCKTQRKLISEICRNNIWNEVWCEYPAHLMPTGHRLIAFLMQRNAYFIMKFIYIIKRLK